MLSTAKSANVSFSQVVQLFAPPTNPPVDLRTKFLLLILKNLFWVSSMCVGFSRVRVRVRVRVQG